MSSITRSLSQNEVQVVTKDRGKRQRIYQEITTSKDATEVYKFISKEFRQNNIAVIILCDARK